MLSSKDRETIDVIDRWGNNLYYNYIKLLNLDSMVEGGFGYDADDHSC
ncbi:hypothetical protein GCM10008013_38400 [Paenibacillus segetis]|uniref:Uncharacterized protein n=1 Tax=Paenibacillus segetis TaxID=1325360 RepID=A0ABQ1YP46_9BACL|nr:hypothetical protein GCM10008013_38400 [Paenibacillus segetis]